MAPEVCKGTPYDFKTDIWSMGMVMMEMAELTLPLAGTPALQVLYIRGKRFDEMRNTI
jgi:serine/threonine protein kinase